MLNQTRILIFISILFMSCGQLGTPGKPKENQAKESPARETKENQRPKEVSKSSPNIKEKRVETLVELEKEREWIGENVADKWPQHLGPNRDGSVAAPGLFDGEVALERIWIQPLGSSWVEVISIPCIQPPRWMLFPVSMRLPARSCGLTEPSYADRVFYMRSYTHIACVMVTIQGVQRYLVSPEPDSIE